MAHRTDHCERPIVRATRRHGRAVRSAVALAAILGLGAAGLAPPGAGAAEAAAAPAAAGDADATTTIATDLSGRHLAAEIRRTAYGVPHVVADDWAGLGFGFGYAFAQDNLCLLAEEVVSANAQRSVTFGASESNLRADLFHQQLIDLGLLEQTLIRSHTAPVPGPTPRVRLLVSGTAEGYNRYLRDVGGAAGITDPACQGADWVREIDEIDLWRTYIDSAVRAGRAALRDAVVTAQPPAAADAASGVAAGPDLAAALAPPATDLGSNAYGLGGEATVDGTGMLLGNPHFPWDGRDRFYQMHLTIPGEYDMIGAALSGQPIVEIGHNATMGWSHTVSTARRFTLYELDLVPGDPTRYFVDGEERAMTSQVVEVQVPDGSGGTTTASRTLWSSEHGPIVEISPLEWTETTAFALKDVNEDAGRTFDGYIEMGRATSVRELDEVLDTWQHLPWINTIAADSTGEAYYGDHSVVPHLTDELLADCITPIGQFALELQGVFVLDGSTDACAWGSDPDARVPGILPPDDLPTIFRDDYVTNSNDSYWLANPEAPLEGFDRIIGVEGTQRSLRTRLGVLQVQERIAGTDGLGDAGFTLERLQEVMFSNRVLAAELVRDDLVALCRDNPEVTVDATIVDVSEACDVLEAWDTRVDLDSRGAHLFREFVGFGGLRFAVPFDVANPLTTPNTLDVADPAVLQALARSVQRWRSAGVALDAPLGDVQTEPRGAEVIPIHGGPGSVGAFNVIGNGFSTSGGGYRNVSSGASYIFAVEFTPEGPDSRAVLAYSNSTDPTSPHYADQTRLYSEEGWVTLPYFEEDILADPELSVTRIEQEPQPTVGSPDPSAGCGTSSVAPGDLRLTVPSGGLDREYIRTVPPAHDGTTPLPLVFDYHGLSEGATIHQIHSQFSPKAVEEGFVVVYPHARGQGLNVSWDTSIGSVDVAMFGDLLDRLESDLCIDRDRVFVTGLSQGGFMTSAIACVYADRVAAAAPVAGVRNPAGCDPARPVPVRTFFGTADPIVPYAPVPGILDAWAGRNGCDAGPPRETPVGADDVATVDLLEWPCPIDAPVELYRVTGGGHSWPGSEFSRTIEQVVGYTTFVISATDLAWEFFEAHPRDGVTFRAGFSEAQCAAVSAFADGLGFASPEALVRVGVQGLRAVAEAGGASPILVASDDPPACEIPVTWTAADAEAVVAAADAWGGDADLLHSFGGWFVVFLAFQALQGG